MVVSEIVTFILYVVSIAFLPEYFGACLWNGHALFASSDDRSGFDRYILRGVIGICLEACCACHDQRTPTILY